jgi:hypothetical protein
VFGLRQVNNTDFVDKTKDTTSKGIIAINPYTKEHYKYNDEIHKNSKLNFGDRNSYFKSLKNKGYEFQHNEKNIAKIFETSTFDCKKYVKSLIKDKDVKDLILNYCKHHFNSEKIDKNNVITDVTDSYEFNDSNGNPSENNATSKSTTSVKKDRVINISVEYTNPNIKTGNNSKDKIKNTFKIKCSSANEFDTLYSMINGINQGKKSKLNESIYNLDTSQREKIAQEVRDSIKFSIDIESKS